MNLAERLAARTGDAAPRWLGVRWDHEANPIRCAGNTVVAHVRDPGLNAAIEAVAIALRETAAGGAFAWLPPSSYHMTVFNGLLYDERDPPFWPEGLDRDVSEDASDRFMMNRLHRVELPAGGPFRMRATGIFGLDTDGLGIAVAPEDPAENARIRGWRDRLAEASGLTGRPGHDDYGFHITLAYLIAWPDAGAAPEFDAAAGHALQRLTGSYPVMNLWPPEFCVFEDMTHFEPVKPNGWI